MVPSWPAPTVPCLAINTLLLVNSQVHSDQEMFSCGSLMARFSTSYLIKSDGCMDHGFSRWFSWGCGFAWSCGLANLGQQATAAWTTASAGGLAAGVG